MFQQITATFPACVASKQDPKKFQLSDRQENVITFVEQWLIFIQWTAGFVGLWKRLGIEGFDT